MMSDLKKVHPVDAYFIDKEHQGQDTPGFKYKASRRLIETIY
jgi:hypothetical protein